MLPDSLAEAWESAPLGRPVVAAGARRGSTYVADLYVITTPHRVRPAVDGDLEHPAPDRPQPGTARALAADDTP
ncbi:MULTISPECIES: hypothetical protein [unclassified Streptomyces]|uniref:hypothetical protein n=1 Tax=unclassified Streptomyces TaxID=2593676 RepID=UPI0038286107